MKIKRILGLLIMVSISISNLLSQTVFYKNWQTEEKTYIEAIELSTMFNLEMGPKELMEKSRWLENLYAVLIKDENMLPEFYLVAVFEYSRDEFDIKKMEAKMYPVINYDIEKYVDSWKFRNNEIFVVEGNINYKWRGNKGAFFIKERYTPEINSIVDLEYKERSIQIENPFSFRYMSLSELLVYQTIKYFCSLDEYNQAMLYCGMEYFRYDRKPYPKWDDCKVKIKNLENYRVMPSSNKVEGWNLAQDYNQYDWQKKLSDGKFGFQNNLRTNSEFYAELSNIFSSTNDRVTFDNSLNNSRLKEFLLDEGVDIISRAAHPINDYKSVNIKMVDNKIEMDYLYHGRLGDFSDTYILTSDGRNSFSNLSVKSSTALIPPFTMIDIAKDFFADWADNGEEGFNHLIHDSYSSNSLALKFLNISYK